MSQRSAGTSPTASAPRASSSPEGLGRVGAAGEAAAHADDGDRLAGRRARPVQPALQVAEGTEGALRAPALDSSLSAASISSPSLPARRRSGIGVRPRTARSASGSRSGATGCATAASNSNSLRQERAQVVDEWSQRGLLERRTWTGSGRRTTTDRRLLSSTAISESMPSSVRRLEPVDRLVAGRGRAPGPVAAHVGSTSDVAPVAGARGLSRAARVGRASSTAAVPAAPWRRSRSTGRHRRSMPAAKR